MLKNPKNIFKVHDILSRCFLKYYKVTYQKISKEDMTKSDIVIYTT